MQQGVPIVTKSDKRAHDVDDITNVFSFRLSGEEMERLGAIQ